MPKNMCKIYDVSASYKDALKDFDERAHEVMLFNM